MKKKINKYLVQARNYIRKYHNQYAEYEDGEVKVLATLLKKAFNEGINKYD